MEAERSDKLDAASRGSRENIGDRLPKLTILLVTYNHEKYIGQALDGLLIQEVPFSYDVVIADDASTDETREHIAHRLSEAGIVHRFLDHSKNLGITKNYQRALFSCSGEYVAVLEGDDYWVRTDKLSKQVEYLDIHRECAGCSANYFVYDQSVELFYPRIPQSEDISYVDSRSLIADNLIGNFSTCVYRRSSLSNIPRSVFDVKSYDWIVNICISQHGLIAFMHEIMSVYRLHSSGTWSALSNEEKIRDQILQIETYDAITGRVFEAEFKALKNRLTGQLAGSGQLRRQGWVGGALRLIHSFVPPIVLRGLRRTIPNGMRRLILGVMGY
ncbi:MAG: glycosyltransferase [Caulobacteraceae bacterium]|nr:glycosyltransferase [Caulobacteraceae bacterium]